jgi:tRNA G18 (ribose-2'-O)-methylase SpoU
MTKSFWFTMNVIDSLKNLAVEDIANICAKNSIPASVAMINIGGDFNLSTMVRNANFFGFRSVHYIGKKKWDKRGSVGTHHYTPIYHHKDESSFISQCSGRSIIAIENNIPEYSYKTSNLFNYKFNDTTQPIFLFGEENKGLSDYILDMSDIILTIPNYGSVRSLNVGTTSGIVMGIYRNFVEQNKTQELTGIGR